MRRGRDNALSLSSRARSARATQPRGKRERLQRFPQAHVVSEKPVQLLLGKTREPRHALRLIRAQVRPERRIKRGFHLRRGQCGGHIFPGTKTLRGEGIGDVGRKCPRHADRARLLINLAVGQHFLHLAPRFRWHEQRAALRRARVRLAGLQPALDFRRIQRHGLAVRGELQVEA